MKKINRTKELTVVQKATFHCDKCNEKIREETFEHFDCEMQLSVGVVEPHEHYTNMTTYLRVDLCQKCADWVFKTLLPENGIKPNNVEWEENNL